MHLIKRILTSPEPIITIGNRLLLIKPGVVLLVKNMPESTDKSARIKDHLMILLEGIIAKVISLNSQAKLNHLLSSNINRVIKDAENALIDIRENQEAHKKTKHRYHGDNGYRSGILFFNMGLTDQQEEQLLAIMTKAVSDSLSHFEAGLEIDNKISGIIDSLADLSSKAQGI